MKQIKPQVWVAAALGAAALILVVVGCLILPDPLVVQIDASGGAGSTMPRLVGLLIPLALTALGAFAYARTAEKRNLVIALVGIALNGLTFVFNL